MVDDREYEGNSTEMDFLLGIPPGTANVTVHLQVPQTSVRPHCGPLDGSALTGSLGECW